MPISAKPLFHFKGLEGTILTASAGSDVDFPLTNLQDRRHSTQWKSGGTTDNQTLTMDSSAPRAVDTVLIANHNLAATGITSLEVRYSTDNFVADDQLAVSITSFTGDPIHSSNTEQNKRYWRLKFVKGGPLIVAPQIGMIFIGKVVTLPRYSIRPRYGLKTETEVEYSMSGLRYSSQLFAEREVWIIRINGLSSSERTEFFRFNRVVRGALHPFWFRDGGSAWHLVALSKDLIPADDVAAWHDLPDLEMEEERVGISPF